MTKSEELFNFMNRFGVLSSVDIRRWGVDNFFISADRVVRKFVENGVVRRLSEEEIQSLNLRKDGGARIAWYKVA